MIDEKTESICPEKKPVSAPVYRSELVFWFGTHCPRPNPKGEGHHNNGKMHMETIILITLQIELILNTIYPSNYMLEQGISKYFEDSSVKLTMTAPSLRWPGLILTGVNTYFKYGSASSGQRDSENSGMEGLMECRIHQNGKRTHFKWKKIGMGPIARVSLVSWELQNCWILTTCCSWLLHNKISQDI